MLLEVAGFLLYTRIEARSAACADPKAMMCLRQPEPHSQGRAPFGRLIVLLVWLAISVAVRSILSGLM